MGRQKITIGPNDFPAWGKLVKTWATGRNYVDHAMTETNPIPATEEMPPQYPKPKSFVDFWDQCAKASIGLIFDDGLNTPVPRTEGMGLVVTQGDADVFVLRLPPQEILLDHEGKIIAGTMYQLPGFYQRLFGGPSLPGEQTPRSRG